MSDFEREPTPEPTEPAAEQPSILDGLLAGAELEREARREETERARKIALDEAAKERRTQEGTHMSELFGDDTATASTFLGYMGEHGYPGTTTVVAVTPGKGRFSRPTTEEVNGYPIGALKGDKIPKTDKHTQQVVYLCTDEKLRVSGHTDPQWSFHGMGRDRVGNLLDTTNVEIGRFNETPVEDRPIPTVEFQPLSFQDALTKIIADHIQP